MSVTQILSTRTDSLGLERLAPDEQLAAGVGCCSVVVFAVVFLLEPSLAVFPVISFLLATLYGWVRNQAETARALTLLATVSTIVILGLITLFLVYKSVTAFRIMGLGIVTKTNGTLWSSSNRVFALAPMIWGTFVTTLIATCIAGPLGIAGAIFIAEMAPGRVRDIVKPGVEMLAGIPSIVYGFIGANIVNPAMMDYLGLTTLGSLFAVGSVIGIMALPTVVSVAEDAITAVPDAMPDGALALGVTNWQSIKSVILPAGVSGISAAVILGVGRAIGETMAATVMLGHNQSFPKPLYNVFGNTETLTTLIVSQYGNAIADKPFLSALFAAGVVLYLTVLTLSIASLLIERRMESRLGGSL